jgi:diacylglycerol O-acyltransferase
MERMSSLDAVFLAVEDAVNHMGIGTVAIFDAPAPSFDSVCGFFAAKIPLVPRCRQRVRMPSGLFGRPVWIDDVGFDLRDHVHHLTLPDPGPGSLEDLAASLLTPPLDRHRALWDAWVVDGLADGRWAIVAKVHHCMVDGIAGTDLLSALLDRAPDAPRAAPDAWIPSSEPSPLAVTRFGVATALRAARTHLRNAVRMLAHAGRSWTHARDVVTAGKQLWYRQRPAPTSLTGPIGTHRRWVHTAVPIDDVAAVRDALGGTVNDVVVAAVSLGFRDLHVGRGESVDDRTVTALVPVSLRAPADRHQVGNRVANVHALLPVGRTDPRSTLHTVHEHLEDLKGSHEIEATGLLLGIGDYVPRAVADRVARIVLRKGGNVETVITNVPGPRSPMYLAGHQMLEGYPIAPIAGRIRITVAIWSYCDRLFIGITGDGDTASDIGQLAEGITRGFADLLDAARANEGGGHPSP